MANVNQPSGKTTTLLQASDMEKYVETFVHAPVRKIVNVDVALKSELFPVKRAWLRFSLNEISVARH